MIDSDQPASNANDLTQSWAIVSDKGEVQELAKEDPHKYDNEETVLYNQETR